MTARPLCFVLMPLGVNAFVSGMRIDFDDVYRTLIAPAIQVAGLEPLRADEEVTGGMLHKQTFDRLILCDYAVADLTTANANVFYQLGVRHSVRPNTTFVLYAEGCRLPFDVSTMRALSYHLDRAGRPSDSEFQERFVAALQAARTSTVDSPVFQLLEEMPPLHIQSVKSDIFRDRVEYSGQMKERLEGARRLGYQALLNIESELGDIQNQESGVVIDLFLSYRAVSAWDRMIALVDKMPRPLQATVMVQEQLAVALNRMGRHDQAEHVLLQLIDVRGPSTETFGLLGRVYKDRREEALKTGENILARDLLDKAIEAYAKGFEIDWRDTYVGIVAVTLMTLRTPPDPRVAQLLPIVRYAVERKIASGKSDYWDYATLLELAVLAEDEKGAMDALPKAVSVIRERWELETTARSLRLIRAAREERNEASPWMKDIEHALTNSWKRQ